MQQHLKKDWAILSFFALLFSIIYNIYYPPISGIEDEIGFINQAILWTHHKLTLDSPFLDGKFLGDLGEHDGHFLFIRNPLRSFTLMPFIWTNQLGGIFYSSLFIHLTLTLVFAIILHHFLISPTYAIFILFHPTLALYSRTIMADTLAATLILLSFLFTIKSKKYGPILSGLSIGIATFARYHAAFALLFFALFYFYFNERRFDFKKTFLCTLSGVIPICLVFLYNFYLFKSPFGLTSNVGEFNLSFFNDNWFFYLVALTIIWPGMLITPFFKFNKYTPLIFSIALFYLLFLLFYYYHDSSNNFLQTLVIGQRLLQIALPFWCLSFVFFISKYCQKWKYQVRLMFTLAILLFISNFFLFKIHQRHLNELIEYKTVLRNVIPANSPVLSTKTLIKLFGIPGNDTPNYTWAYFTFIDKNSDHLYQDIIRQDFYLAILLKDSDEFKIKSMNNFVQRYQLALIKKHKLLYIFKNPRQNQKS